MGPLWITVVAITAVQAAGWLALLRYLRRKSREQRPVSPAELARRDEKILALYAEIEGMLDSFEEYVREVHKELEGSRAELLELSRRIQWLRAEPSAATAEPEPVSADEPAAPPPRDSAPSLERGAAPEPIRRPSRLSGSERETLNRLATKAQKVRYLMSRGMALEEVAQELDIGKGEVKLIADLDKS